MYRQNPRQNHRLVLLRHRTTMAVTLQNLSGIPPVLQVSRSGAVTHIVQIVQQGAVRRPHTLFVQSSNRRCLDKKRGGGGTLHDRSCRDVRTQKQVHPLSVAVDTYSAADKQPRDRISSTNQRRRRFCDGGDGPPTHLPIKGTGRPCAVALAHRPYRASQWVAPVGPGRRDVAGCRGREVQCREQGGRGGGEAHAHGHHGHHGKRSGTSHSGRGAGRDGSLRRIAGGKGRHVKLVQQKEPPVRSPLHSKGDMSWGAFRLRPDTNTPPNLLGPEGGGGGAWGGPGYSNIHTSK